MAITFGTDGWRAVISDEFTFANVRLVAQAIAEVLLENAAPGGRGRAAAGGGRLRHPLPLGPLRVGGGRGAGGERLVRQSDEGRCADAGGLIRHPHAGGGRRRDDHRQPQSAALQRHQAEVRLRRQRDVADTKRVEASSEAALAAAASRSAWNWMRPSRGQLVDRFDPFPAYAAHLEQLIDFDTIGRAESAGRGRCDVRGGPQLPEAAAGGVPAARSSKSAAR